MEILMIEHFLPGNTYSLELSKELGCLVDLSLLCSTEMPNGSYNFNCLNKLYTGGRKKLPAMVSYAKSLYYLCHELEKGYDIVHVQTMKATKYEIPIYMRMKKKIGPLVYTVHNMLPHEYVQGEKERLAEFYHTCDALIAHNEYTRQLLIDNFDIASNQIHVISHGTYADIIEEQKHQREDFITYLLFGTIRKYKGVDILLEAISKISVDKRKKMRFIIAGKQVIDKTDYKAMLLDLQIEECVRFINQRVPYEEIPNLFREADVCVFPYREIYGSGALLMAYSFCKPVIVSDVPSFLEETENGQTGLLFENENSDSLAETLCDFLELPEQKINTFRTNIKRLISEKYNWKLSAQKTIEVYKKLLNL